MIRGVTLPSWVRDEDMLRRILILREERRPMAALLVECGITRGAWSRLRAAARRSQHPGDRAVARAFLKRFDAIPAPQPARRAKPMFSEAEGIMLADSIAKWDLKKGRRRR